MKTCSYNLRLQFLDSRQLENRHFKGRELDELKEI